MSGPRGGSGHHEPAVVYVTPATSSIRTVRRYYLRKSQELQFRWEEGLAAALRGRLNEYPGTPLPATYSITPGSVVAFPFLAELARANYTCWEDLNGADAAELLKWVHGIRNLRDAQQVLAAWAALPPVTVPEINPASS